MPKVQEYDIVERDAFELLPKEKAPLQAEYIDASLSQAKLFFNDTFGTK